MSPYDVFTSPLTLNFSVADKGRVATLLSLFVTYGDGEMLELSWQTLARNLRLRSATPDALQAFLDKLRDNLLLVGSAIEGIRVRLEATRHLLPPAYQRDSAELALSAPDFESGRAPSETREAQARRKAEQRARQKADTEAMEACLQQLEASQTAVTSPVTVTDLSQPREAFGHDIKTGSDQDRSDPDLFIKSDPDRIGSSKGSGETQPVTSLQNAVTLETWERDLIALLGKDKEQWSPLEIREAVRRLKEQMAKQPIKSKPTYLRTILAQLRAEGFDQQRAAMLHGMVTGGQSAPKPLKAREPGGVTLPEPCASKPADAPAIAAFKAKRTGTEG